MGVFFEWLVFRDTATLLRLRLLEAAEFFSPAAYNPLFDSELAKVIARIHDPDLRRQVEGLKGFDWANYISRSLLRAGFRDDDQQEHFHAIAVRLLVEPGKLFRGWQPQRHGPLERRFRRSVWNSIRNIVQKRQNWRKWMTTADPSIMADRMPAKAPPNNIISEFRRLVAERLGIFSLTGRVSLAPNGQTIHQG